MTPVQDQRDREHLIVIGQLTEATKQTSQLVRDMMETMAENQKVLGQCIAKVDHCATTVDRLDNVVRQGNGRSLVSRVDSATRDLDEIREWRKGIESDRKHREHHNEDQQGRKSRALMSGGFQIVVAAIGVISVVVNGLLSLLGGHKP